MAGEKATSTASLVGEAIPTWKPHSSAAAADGQTRPTANSLLCKELCAIRQTLDLPPDTLSGLTAMTL
jgi:hypothetical protein